MYTAVTAVHRLKMGKLLLVRDGVHSGEQGRLVPHPLPGLRATGPCPSGVGPSPPGKQVSVVFLLLFRLEVVRLHEVIIYNNKQSRFKWKMVWKEQG